MKVVYNSANGRLSVELEGEQINVFEQISSFQEVFENTVCGKCNSEEIRYVVRVVDDNEFPELHCQNKVCRARLAFGQHKQGKTLFPKRKDSEGKWLPNNGWVKYNTQTGKDE